MYPYSISYMNREEVLLTNKELIDIYNQIADYICEDEELLDSQGRG